jgi:hypothetical protein
MQPSNRLDRYGINRYVFFCEPVVHLTRVDIGEPCSKNCIEKTQSEFVQTNFAESENLDFRTNFFVRHSPVLRYLAAIGYL